MLFAIVVFFVLPDYPKSKRSAKWLTPREQEYLELRLTDNAPRTHDSVFDKAEVVASLKNPRTYAFCLSQILMNLGGYGLQWQLPTVTTALGFAGLPRNQLLNIPPAAATVLAIIFAGWFLSKAYLTRPQLAMFICAGALAFFLVLCFHVNRYATYIACIFGTMFYSVYFIPFWACKCFLSPFFSLSRPVCFWASPVLEIRSRSLTSFFFPFRALRKSRRLDGDSVHSGLPVLHRTGRRRRGAAAVPVSLRAQQLPDLVCHLCRCHRGQLDRECLDVVSHARQRGGYQARQEVEDQGE